MNELNECIFKPFPACSYCCRLSRLQKKFFGDIFGSKFRRSLRADAAAVEAPPPLADGTLPEGEMSRLKAMEGEARLDAIMRDLRRHRNQSPTEEQKVR